MCFLQCNIVARCLNIFTDLLTLKDDRKTGGWCVFWLKMVLKDFGYCLITASRDGDESKKILPLM